jgi:hypothetical protein
MMFSKMAVCIMLMGAYFPNYGIVIDERIAREIEEQLAQGDATTVYEYPPRDARSYEPLIIAHSITWRTPATLVLVSKEDIIIKPTAYIYSLGTGSFILKAGIENEHNKDYNNEPVGTIVFEDLSTIHIHMNRGKVKIYYNLQKGKEEHKYWNGRVNTKDDRVEEYVLVNHIKDLQNIRKSLSHSYALSQDIDARETREWDQGKGFRPLWQQRSKDIRWPFGYSFDGNGYTISHLFINRPDEDRVGLFRELIGGWDEPTIIENLTIKDAQICGRDHVGGLAGWAEDTLINNVSTISCQLEGKDNVGGLIGTGDHIQSSNVSVLQPTIKVEDVYHGLLFGRAYDSIFTVTDHLGSCTSEDVGALHNTSIRHKTPFGFLTTKVAVCARLADNNRGWCCTFGSDKLLYDTLSNSAMDRLLFAHSNQEHTPSKD